MKRLLKKMPLLLFALILSLACESTEGGGSGGTEPVLTAPEIIEGFMCTGIFEGKPVGIDNDFFLDERVYVWLSWTNVVGTHEVKILWVAPTDKIFETKDTFESANGKMTTYFWLDTTDSAPVGQWLAEIYLDDNFIRSYTFWLNQGN